MLLKLLVSAAFPPSFRRPALTPLPDLDLERLFDEELLMLLFDLDRFRLADLENAERCGLPLRVGCFPWDWNSSHRRFSLVWGESRWGEEEREEEEEEEEEGESD